MIKPVLLPKLICILCLVPYVFMWTDTHAQQFGGNPPSVNWRQVNTPAARVIFPHGLDSIAPQVANVANSLSGTTRQTLGAKQKQVNIVLQNQTTISNAYVGLAPYRSEFYLTPPQNSFEIGSYNWPVQLAIHEYRHVQQYNNFNVGASKVLSVLFGQGGQALGNELSIPDWFFEGDAVFQETLVSRQGRGRLPFFYNGYRALWQAGKDYSWMKLRNGSYVDYVPDHYQLGYIMVAYGRENYGSRFWKNVTHDAASFNGVFYPFQKAVTRYSGIKYEDFGKRSLNHFKQQFTIGDVDRSSQRQHFIANREYPAFINDSTLVYAKSSYNKRSMFVLSKGGKETVLRVRDISLDDYFDYHAGKIVYASYRPDLRWGYRNYSEIQVLDVATDKQRRLTNATKYFAPSLSDDGKQIVAVDVSTAGKAELHILNAETGALIRRLKNPDGWFYTYPKFYGQNKIISAAREANGEMSLLSTDILTGANTTLLQTGVSPISFLNVYQGKAYFSASKANNDQLYAYDIANRRLERLNSPATNIGNYQIAVTDKALAYVTFNATGYQLITQHKNQLQWEQVDAPEVLGNLGITALVKDSASNLLGKVKDEPRPITKYPKAFQLFNFHSLIPALDDPSYTLSLMGENVLNTFQSELYGRYNRNEGYKELGFEAVYGALFPYLMAGANYTVDRRGLYQSKRIYWNEKEAHVGLRVPLNFTSGTHVRGLTFGSDWVYNSTNFQSPYNAMFNNRNYTYLNNYVSFSNRTQQARQNIYPKFGQTISLNYKRAITNIKANQFLANGYLYLPGLFNNHSLVINAAHQQKDRQGALSFSNGLPFSRGYTAENLYKLNKIGANYHFPLAYPDAGVADLIYVLRLRGNVFYDYTHGNDFYTSGTKFSADFKSTGAELYFDTQWFNQVPITFGVRYSHLLNNNLFGSNGRNVVELIVPVSIF